VIDTIEPEVVIQGGAGIESQLKAQIREQVLARRLFPGEQLPSVRSLAVGLSIKPGIVERVYRELEEEGVLNFEEGTGVFVADPNCACLYTHADSSGLRELCRQFIAKTGQFGYSLDEVIDELAALNMRRQS